MNQPKFLQDLLKKVINNSPIGLAIVGDGVGLENLGPHCNQGMTILDKSPDNQGH